MSKQKETKTNAMREIEAAGVPFESYLFPCEKALSGVEVAKLLQQDPDQTFKTLVTVAKSGEHYVFMVPVAEELDLKKAAAAVGEKAVSMLKSKELLPLTGYVHGGCSPVGMKKLFTTTIDETAQLFDTIMFSGGRIGCQVELAPRKGNPASLRRHHGKLAASRWQNPQQTKRACPRIDRTAQAGSLFLTSATPRRRPQSKARATRQLCSSEGSHTHATPRRPDIAFRRTRIASWHHAGQSNSRRMASSR